MPTAAQLVARRRLVAAATKRHPPRAVPAARLPRPTAYTRALSTIADDLNAAAHEALRDEGLPAPRSDAADGDAAVPPFDRSAVLARLKRVAEAVVKRRGGFLDTALDAVAANVSNLTRAEWSRQAKAAVGIDLAKIEPNLAPVISTFRRANVELITSMARDKVERVKALLDEHAGARVETLRDKILEEGNVTKRQAALIARDQVLSLNAQVTEKRHAAAGVEEYVWRTSGDGDVRPAHRALDGKRFKYSEPPVVDAKKGRRENPGTDYQCRCVAEPVIPGFTEDEPAAPAAAPAARAPTSRPTDPDDGPITVSPREVATGRSIPREPARIRYAEPPPPPTARQRETPKRNTRPLDSEPAPGFTALPIKREIQGVALRDHMQAAVQYPKNHVGDGAFAKHVDEVANAALESVHPADVKALERFTGPAYKRVNLALREGRAAAEAKFGAKAVADVDEIVEGTKRALAALPRAPADMTLFRGMEFKTTKELDAFASGAEVESKAFMSTTRDPKVAVGFGGGEFGDDPSVVLRIRKHRSAAMLPSDKSNASESEILFSPGARFRIVGRQRVSETQLVLDLEEV